MRHDLVVPVSTLSLCHSLAVRPDCCSEVVAFPDAEDADGAVSSSFHRESRSEKKKKHFTTMKSFVKF